MVLQKIYKLFQYIKSFFIVDETMKESIKISKSINIDIPKIKQLKK